ncbi:MAG: hypothetical protein CM15mP93_05840 [Thiotrichaceae bacterium]|nr:MAG: hypothetical protein CM15mP93_05840 [Thiotrichaceae bacterium]
MALNLIKMTIKIIYANVDQKIVLVIWTRRREEISKVFKKKKNERGPKGVFKGV